MTDVDVFLEWRGKTRTVGLMRRHASRQHETVTFEYHPQWLSSPDSFSIDTALPLGSGVFRPPANTPMFATLGDSAPDTWGRMLMRRRERRLARSENRQPRTLQETNFLLGVADVSRLGALRFGWHGDTIFQAPQEQGVPDLLALGELLEASERIIANNERADDLQLIFAPGSSLGGARPKASVVDQHRQLSIAKFPKQTDSYSLERWEAIALDLAAAAGVTTAAHQLINVAGQPVLLSRRFDRHNHRRIPFSSAMSLTQHRDGDRGSYLDIVDALAEHGSDGQNDRTELFRRIAFSILVSNVDDHLRNHGFLRHGQAGWALSPAYDLNPTPKDIKAGVLATNIDFDDGTCSIDLLRSVAEEFSLDLAAADAIIKATATVTCEWRQFANRSGAPTAEVNRMESAFEHEVLRDALAL